MLFLWVNWIYFKLAQSLIVLLALAAVVLGAEEVQDQQAAEQFFSTYGYYPTWYTGYSAFRSAAYPYAYSARSPLAYSTYSARYPLAYSAYTSGYPYAYAAPYAYNYLG